MDWYPWGEEAFALARRLDRPVLLSVGYSSCHWCHVMAHECFEDADLAALQNELFVSIKVDREERPDIDRVYMDALQAMTGGGGWPMTVFLLPDARPFFAGTYFPPQDRAGLPGFGRVMRSIAQAYRERGSEVRETAGRLNQALQPAPLIASRDREGLRGLLARASSRLIRYWDRGYGGFGDAPKFPQLPVLEFLLARHVIAGDSEAWDAVRSSLTGMARGGIWDQIGEGLHRYSVDRRWAVPHFEKMLYDNAQLLRVAVHAWQARGEDQHLELARASARFLLAEMELPGGGFAASLDADTEAGEGAYYVWTDEQLRQALGSESEVRLVEELFGGEGPARTPEGGLVLRGGLALESDAGPDPTGTPRRQLAARLLRARQRRPAPARDRKLVLGWNALAIRALAEFSVATQSTPQLDAALRAAQLIRERAADGEGGFRHLYDGGTARFGATLDDLAAWGLAGLALHEASGEPGWFELALHQAEVVEGRYRDSQGPGWFDVPTDHDPVLATRPRSLEDGAQPSGMALMAELCLRLHALTGDHRWRERGEAALLALASAAERFPSAFGALLTALQLLESGPVELALLVPPGRRRHWELLTRARARFRPSLTVGVAVPISDGTDVAGGGGPPLTWSRPLLEGRATAYVCRDFACRLPVSAPADLERELDAALA